MTAAFTWFLAAAAAGATLLAWGEPGEPRSPWREVRYSDRSHYAVIAEGERVILRAESRDQNSALLRPVALDPRGVTLRWRWRVLVHPEGADPNVRARDDRAAAVLVLVRRSFLPWRTRGLLYQWTPARPQGEWGRSPYASEVRTVTLRDDAAGPAWHEESRDLEADLARAFGRLPAKVEAIGVICDTDDTGTSAAAEFGAIEIVRGPQP